MTARALSLLSPPTLFSHSASKKATKSSSLLPVTSAERRFSPPAGSFFGDSIHQPLRSPSISSKLRLCGSATILSMLPTAKPNRQAADKISKWSARAIKSFGMAELEARKLKYPTTGTEALLMGILVEGTSRAAKFLRENGIMLFKVREDAVKLLGKSDMYFFSPEHPPLTEPAQRALDWAVDEKLKSVVFLGIICWNHLNAGEGDEITTTHMLLGIWSEKDSAGHKILASLGFDDQKASELEKSGNDEVLLSYR
ncbi:Clp protease-related protein [Platanthera guangdongensis]|uniref:Clp protease-related protein n=1 Tax=Platanthera guangdongensis TaxID=2320717 RepID=A0ABR2LMC0_9ASPA